MIGDKGAVFPDSVNVDIYLEMLLCFTCCTDCPLITQGQEETRFCSLASEEERPVTH